MAKLEYLNYIDGEWVGAEKGETYTVINPANGQRLADVPKGSEADARAAIDAAREVQGIQAPAPRRNDLADRAGLIG